MEQILGNALGNTTFKTEIIFRRENRFGESVTNIFQLADYQTIVAVMKEKHNACGADRSGFYDESICNDSSFGDYEERLYNFDEIPAVTQKTEMSNTAAEQTLFSPKKLENISCMLLVGSGKLAGNPFQYLAADTKEKHGACGEDGSHFYDDSTSNDSIFITNVEPLCNIDKIPGVNQRTSMNNIAEGKNLFSSKVLENVNSYSPILSINGKDGEILEQISDRNADVGGEPEFLWNRIRRETDSSEREYHNKTCTGSSCGGDGNNNIASKTPNVSCKWIKTKKSLPFRQNTLRNDEFAAKRRDRNYQRCTQLQSIKTENRYSCLVTDDMKKKTKGSNEKINSHDKRTKSVTKKACAVTKVSTGNITISSTQKPDTQDNQISSGYKVSSKGFLQGTLRGGYVSFLLVLLVAACYGDSIGLLSVGPIVFGHNVILRCDLYNQTTFDHLAWLRRDDGEVLTNGNMSTNPEKFQSEIQYMDNQVSYRLKILQFNESDVDPIYRCTYGFHALFFNLSINEENFRYFPLETEITQEIELKNSILNVSVILPKVYPIPICDIYIEDMLLYTDLNTTIESRPPFYMARLTFVTTAVNSICGVPIIIRCRIGNETREILTERLRNCNMMEQNSHQVIVVSILICIAVVIAGIGVMMKLRVSRLKNDSSIGEANRPNKLEVESLMPDAIT